MQNYYYTCDVCGTIFDLKYQFGYSKRHPIRFKCTCGVTISGEYDEKNKITMKNATVSDDTDAKYVVNVSGEFLTRKSYPISCKEESIRLSPYMEAVNKMDYESYCETLTTILTNRDTKYPFIRAINELYEAGNITLLKEKIHEVSSEHGIFFPLQNDADILRAVTMINQFQFLGIDDLTKKTADYYKQAMTEYPLACIDFFNALLPNDTIKEWKYRINTICEQVYEKIDLLMPAISIDYYYDKSIIHDENLRISTTTFEDIKQLYSDMYELIARLLIIPIGLDNILIRKDYQALNTVKGLSVTKLDGVPKMRNKGNIIKLINCDEPFQSLLCTCLNSDVRNSIGHYSYHAKDISSTAKQTIIFMNDISGEEELELSLTEICYNIWSMYKSLAIFNELIHHIELHKMASEKNIYPSFIGNPFLAMTMLGINKPKIYPNDMCPCGSGLKYKKCCKPFIQHIK